MTETVSGPSGSARKTAGKKRNAGLKIERVYTTEGVTRTTSHLGTSRRRADQLEDRRERLRAARCGVPRLLERQRLHDRHDQVLPRRRRRRRA